MRNLTIDTTRVVELVCNAAARLAILGERPEPDQPLPTVIDWIRRISAQAGEELRATLSINYPNIGWADEDHVIRQEERPYWLYDPVDGAYHFIQGLPLWSSSLVLIMGGRPVFSIVHDPVLKETFVAQQGCGATCNGRNLAVSPKRDPGSSALGTSIPPLAQVGREERDRAIALLRAASDNVFVIRPMAAASLQLAYVAAGRLDGFWETGNDPGDWLAGSLLVTEAGGQATTLAGGEIATGDGILTGNRAICDHLQRAFRNCG
ncbi:MULTISPECIES: inositol monophosphatase family protein [unclassified Rhizobium]|uniref:inositol monophosphatase family protein n=1 Tax=unclassified Rhizobium TaxID=2613769 RepID=UPI000AA737F8|nr:MULTISPECIES: inositol monophosphatase [unclassified Rhizobium]